MSTKSSRDEILSAISGALGREVASMPSSSRRVDDRATDQVIGTAPDEKHAREELIARFEAELGRVGGLFYRAATPEEGAQYIVGVALERKIDTVVGCDGTLIERVDLQESLAKHGVKLLTESNDKALIKSAMRAGIGVSRVDYALADTGTLVLLARKGEARSISLLPSIHIAVLRPAQILPGLNELFASLEERLRNGMPSAITFITGPSRTADIELTLVVGVHGPQHLHVVLLES